MIYLPVIEEKVRAEWQLGIIRSASRPDVFLPFSLDLLRKEIYSFHPQYICEEEMVFIAGKLFRHYNRYVNKIEYLKGGTGG